MVRRLFICCTPYQIFNCINVTRSVFDSNEECDLIICNHFPNSKKIYEHCKKQNIWTNCYHMNTEYNRQYMETMMIIEKLDFARMIEGEHSFHWEYDEVYLGTFNNIASIIAYRYCKKYNRRLCFIDEGIATYTLQSFDTLFSKKQRLFRKLTDQVIRSEYVDLVYLYHPEWYCGSFHFNLKAIPSIDRNQKTLIQQMNSVFEYMDDGNNTECIVFFDQPLANGYKDFLTRLTGTMDRITAGHYNFQWHPRGDRELQQQFAANTIQTVSLGGWELYLLNMRKKVPHIYITPYSSAALLGKMLFNDDDIVVFLYKLLDIQNEKVDRFITKIRVNQPKLYIPESWEEFEMILTQNYHALNIDNLFY